MFFTGIALTTRDVRRLSAFYQMILGAGADCDDENHQVILTQGASLAITKGEDGGSTPACLIFTVPDTAAECARLRGLGVEILDPPTPRPWGAVNMRFADPDGNAVYFRSFPGEAVG